MNGVIIALLLACLSGLGYLIYEQKVAFPRELNECNDIAVMMEKARHAPVDDLQVTNQDIASYMKNVVNCLAI